MTTPSIVVIGGPNGAGKTTISRSVLADSLAITEFVNADTIAAGLSGFNPEHAAIAAGRIMLARLHELADSRADFAFESTLSSRSFAPWLTTLRASGYRIHVIFIFLKSPALAVRRVQIRIRKGGHSIPPDTIRRRYSRAVRNFISLYIPIADVWHVYDNSSSDGARLVAHGCHGRQPDVLDESVWEHLHAIARSQDKQDDH